MNCTDEVINCAATLSFARWSVADRTRGEKLMSRILFIGENWYGSNARSCAEGLRRLGHNVFDIDEQSFFPQVTMLTSRIVSRLLSSRLVKEFNHAVLRATETFQPDMTIAFKGTYLYSSTLQALHNRGIPLYNYFPDTSAFAHGKWLPGALKEYDCIFYTKRSWYSDFARQIPLKAGHFLPHGYDPSLHRPVQLDARDIADYGCDVSFIATHSRYKEGFLEELIHLRPSLNLCIWGNGWINRCESAPLRKFIKGFALTGDAYSRGIQAAQINLAIMSGPVMGASSKDLTTSRTYLIPAIGGFMLHERNSEVLNLYEEGKEIACFDSAKELAEKIEYYLAHPQEREAVSQGGRKRCVPAYSYDNRMAEILRWHFEHRANRNLQTAANGS